VRGKVLAGIAIACVSACTANPGRSSIAVPLQIPEPPPRVAIDPRLAPEPQAESVPVPASRPTADIPAPNPPRAGSGTAAVPASVPAAQVLEPPRPAPPTDLLPAGPPGSTPTAGQVLDALGRTKQKLNSIDRQRLNAGRRADHDSALRFLAQAEAAVSANNLMLAQSSVEKAEALADGLK